MSNNSETKMPFAERVGRFVLFPLSWMDRAATARKVRQQEAAAASEAERQREIDAQNRAMEQQRAAEAAAEKARLEQEEIADKARAEKARYRCQLVYDQHEYKIRDKFPQAKLERYFEQYMSDEFPVDMVERRGLDLEAMILGFLDNEKPKGPQSRVEITEFYEQQRADARATGQSPEVIEKMIVDINAREDQALIDFVGH